MKKRLTKDFETRSQANLKLVGAYQYSLHPSTRPTCLAFKLHGESRIYFLDFNTVNSPWRRLPAKFRWMWEALIDEGFEFSAHNSFFERCIYDNIMVKRYGWPEIPPRQRRCTAAKAAACALPRALDKVGDALKLNVVKDKRGHAVVMATCKPTKKWNAWKKLQDRLKAGSRMNAKTLAKAHEPEPPVFLEPEHDPKVWADLYAYCKQDVRAEEAVDDAIPDLIPQEQEVWHFNQKLNWRGLTVDVPTITKIVSIMDREDTERLKELDKVTMGLVSKPGSIRSIKSFLEIDGIKPSNLQAKTIEDLLKGFDLSSDTRRLLELRKLLTMASTKKYRAFLANAAADHRVRDLALYHAASTGRDGGQRLNPYNFPRGVIYVEKGKPYAAVDNVAELDFDMLQLLYGQTLPLVFSSILRNMIVPSPGCELFVGDFSKVEVAVLWWLAGNEPGLQILRAGKDPYIYMAAANLGKTYEEVERAVNAEEKWALDARQLGKAQILGCGFGMGAAKFLKTGWDQYRLKLSEDQSVEAVTAYRFANEAVPKVWKAYEKAAIGAVETGSVYEAGKCRFFTKNNFLWVELPSGRRLAYRDPQISWRESEYGPRKTLEFWAVNSKTKKWALERTWGGTLTENIVQATARDCLMPGLLRLEDAGYRVLLSVYDEAVTERKTGRGSVSEFTELLCRLPAWGEGLPLEAKAWADRRYKK